MERCDGKNELVIRGMILQLSMDGKIINKFNNSIEAYKATGVCSRNILQVASHEEYKPGKTRSQAVGFLWRYEEVM